MRILAQHKYHVSGTFSKFMSWFLFSGVLDFKFLHFHSNCISRSIICLEKLPWHTSYIRYCMFINIYLFLECSWKAHTKCGTALTYIEQTFFVFILCVNSSPAVGSVIANSKVIIWNHSKYGFLPAWFVSWRRIIIIKFIKEIMLCNILIETSILCPLYDIIWSDTSRIDAATMC